MGFAFDTADSVRSALPEIVRGLCLLLMVFVVKGNWTPGIPFEI